MRDEAPYGCTVSLFHLHSHRFRIPRPVAVRRRPPGLQPHQAAGEGLLLPVHLDPPGNLQSAGQSARASLLRQSPQAQRSLPFRLLGKCPYRRWTGAAKILPVRILFRQRVEDADGGLSSCPPLSRHTGSLLIQHGSYQWVSLEDQPSIPAGEVSLYRGIGQATRFRCLRFRPEELSPANGEIWRKYLRVQADMLSDSILSFNTIHDRVKRCETAGLRDGTWVGDELATQAGLDIQSPGFARDLWHAAQQSYSLEQVMGVVKFGPHHVVLKTPLSNIRITTFFAGESEAKIVDPSRISEVQAVGCEVEFAPPME